MIRGFEVVSTYADDEDINIPQRKTGFSAGYDLESAQDVVIAPGEVVLVPTGLKAYMMDDEYLAVKIRSSIAVKKLLVLINSEGVIDADYYNNPENEGHIVIPLYNQSLESKMISKGDRIAQGIFLKFLKTDDDNPGGTRISGCGSTGK
jgi:dUTP pyrophosphatase